MISDDTVRVIQVFLREGHLTQNAIAKLTGVSKGTVQAIAQGRRKYLQRGQEVLTNEAATGLIVRCPDCGGMTQMPCMVCDRLSLKEQALAKNRLTTPGQNL